ncbi:MAG: Jag N-terminal domain-containing protein [Clostridia bacterium]|nr:Jag N-terminal domain-containing protein [Clostridia bacterium]
MEKRSYTATGKTVEEALENAKAGLGIDTIDGFNFEIVEYEKKGFLGLGSKPAKVRVYEEIEQKPQAKAKEIKHDRHKHEKKQEQGERKQPQKKAEPTHAREAQPEQKKAEATGTPVDESCAALVFVRTTLKNLGLTATAEGYIDEEGITRIIVRGSDATMLIGHHGDTLDSFQYLANLAANREFKSGDKNHNRVTVDIEDYRSKREQTLRALARRMAHKALKYNKSVMLEPMNPYERRIIHSEIQSIEGVATNSIGSENNRKVVIYLTDGKKKNAR